MYVYITLTCPAKLFNLHDQRLKIIMFLLPDAQVEQPSSSRLIFVPYLQHCIAAMGEANVMFRRLWLGGFGSGCGT